jgi:hypothetical protein
VPDAGASGGNPAGSAAPGEASAFRRALDKQAVAEEPGNALVPSGAHDLTMPIDMRAIRAALAYSQATDSHKQTQLETQIPTQIQPQMQPPLPVVRTPTVIQRPDSAVPDTSTSGPGSAIVATTPPQRNEPPADGADRDDSSDRQDGGGRAPARLPTAVWISAVLAAIAGAALILVDQGHGSDPLAPSALPAKASSPAPASYASHSVIPPSRTHSASPRASHSASPSKSAGPTASASATASPGSGTTPVNLAQGSTGAAVVDVQRRLADLGLMTSFSGSSSFRDSGWTLWEVQQQRGPSPDVSGYYGKATDYAIIAFKHHFMNNDDGTLPSGGCDAQTYAKLLQETAGLTG